MADTSAVLAHRLAAGITILAAFACSPARSDDRLAGLWEARRQLGPELHGSLLIREVGDALQAEIGGERMAVAAHGTDVRFEASDGSRFHGIRDGRGAIVGHWLQPPSPLDGNVYATPVTLERRDGGWYGDVRPQPDTGTFYLLLQPRDDVLMAELINPERNLGVFTRLSRAELAGEAVSLLGTFRGRGKERVMLRGRHRPDQESIAVSYPGRGGLYEFRRVAAQEAFGFLARRSGGDPLVTPPPRLDDGWPTASPAEVGLDSAPIVRLIDERILPPPTSTQDLSIHALLIARRGRLVVEEYFHGYHRDLPHDSRSASKSITAVLAAAAMRAGAPLGWDTPIYALLDPERLKREPLRGRITLQHLVDMSSGLDCDDRDPESRGNEDVLWDNADELDFYDHTLGVDVVHPPGKVTAYCSASAHLVGGVIAAAAREPLLRLLHRLLAVPMQIDRYAVVVPPDGHPFMGGGARWRPRDFLKFPQMILDGGTWNGRRIVDAEEARRLTTPTVVVDGAEYGHLWWSVDYPYRGRSVRAHYMSGNGGQLAMLVPELDLTLAVQAGNYSDRVFFTIQQEIVPELILPAVRE